MTEHFFHIDDLTQGLARKLTNGITTRIFPGDQAMLSVVRISPNAQGTLHSHPEEQWGYMIEGSATRIQNGEHMQVEKGSFWRTPGNVEHSPEHTKGAGIERWTTDRLHQPVVDIGLVHIHLVQGMLLLGSA